MKKTMKIAVIAIMGMSFGIKAQENFSSISLTGYNPISSVNGFQNKIQFTGASNGALVFNPGKINELMFGMHVNGNFYWGTGRSASKPNFYSMILNGNNGNLSVKGNLNANNSIVSKVIKMDSGNTDLFMYRDGDVGDWSLLRTNKGNGIGLIGKPDQVALSVSRSTGNVGIRTTDTKGFELGVNGKIAANEVKVAIYPNWPDFVFETKYNLPTLKEVENHIKEKGHLKDIPSAKEVGKSGFFLGKMNAKLLQKIEELTLYTIEQEKKIKKLEKQQKEIDELKALVQKLLKDKN